MADAPLPAGLILLDDDVTEPIQSPATLPAGLTLVQPEVTSVVEEPSKPELDRTVEDSFIQSVAPSFVQAGVDVRDTLRDLKDGTVKPSHAVTQVAGKGVVNPLIRTGGEVIKRTLGPPLAVVGGAASSVYMFLPEGTREDIKDYAASALQWVVESPAAEEAFIVAQQGAEAYGDWRDANPQDAKTLESIVNISSLITPLGKRPTSTSPEGLRRLLDSGVDAFTASARKNRQSFADSIMRSPKQSGVGSTAGRTTENFFGSETIQLNAFEQEAADVLTHLPLNLRGTAGSNYRVVDNHLVDAAKKLEEKLEGIPVEMDLLNGKLDNALKEIFETDIFIRNNKEFRAISTDLINKSKTIFAKTDGTAADLLRARREIDKLVRDQKGAAAFGSERTTPLNAAFSSIRQVLNEVIDATAPGSENELRRQHLLYSARTILDDKYAAQASGALGKLTQAVTQGTGVKLPSTPLALGATAGAALTMLNSSWLPYLGFAMGIPAVGVLAYRGLMSPASRTFMANLLRNTNKLIKKTPDPVIRAALNADRVILIDLIKNIKVEKGVQEDVSGTRAPQAVLPQ
jgi:hypothetical protein